jgi:flagellar FliL protein
MADETPAPPAEGGEIPPPPKASNPMIPLAIVLVAMPAISFAMVKFVLVPQIQKAATGGAPAAAGAHGAGAAPSAEPAKDAKKDEHGGGHGKDDKAKDAKDGKKAARSKDGWEYSFPNVVSNLTGSMGTRYLRCSFTVVSDDEHISEMMEENKTKLKDAALRIFAARSQSDLESVSARNVIRTEIAATFNKALETAAVKEVLFTDFIVQ